MFSDPGIQYTIPTVLAPLYGILSGERLRVLPAFPAHQQILLDRRGIGVGEAARALQLPYVRERNGVRPLSPGDRRPGEILILSPWRMSPSP
jgi:hypothetical protein